MANQFKNAQQQVEQALALLDTETADQLIGQPPPEEYSTLIQGLNGAYQMLWTMAASNGLKQTPAVCKMGGQAQLTMLTLLHYAYALGLQAGQKR